MTAATIPGYDYGTEQVARSPLSIADFELLKQAVLFGPDDERYLRMAGDVLADQIEDAPIYGMGLSVLIPISSTTLPMGAAMPSRPISRQCAAGSASGSSIPVAGPTIRRGSIMPTRLAYAITAARRTRPITLLLCRTFIFVTWLPSFTQSQQRLSLF